MSVAHLRQEPSAGDAAKAFADSAGARLRLLSQAARQVLAAPGVQEEPLFGKTLHKVSAQLQESAQILEKWGGDYAHSADANEMAVALAEQGAAFEVQDLKRQLRAAIEADQEAELEQPKKLAELTKKVASLRSQLDHVVSEEVGKETPSKSGTMLISNVWPRPARNATKAELGLFMHRRKVKVTAKDQNQEDRERLVKLESRLGSLESQLKEAHSSIASSHANAVDAHLETMEAAK